jgi:hypothetical protein
MSKRLSAHAAPTGLALGFALTFALANLALASKPTDENASLATHYAAAARISLAPNEGLQRLALTLPVLQASRSPHWADVRVLDRTGQPVPIARLPALAPERAQAEDSTVSSSLPLFAWPSPSKAHSNATQASEAGDLRVEINRAGAVVRIESSPGSTVQTAVGTVASPPQVWLVDLSSLPRPGRAIERLQLDWPTHLNGLSTRVDVHASDNARDWSHIASGPLLELPSADPGMSASMPIPNSVAPSVKHVEWPSRIATPRYLRLSFEQPLALRTVQLRWQPTPSAAALNTTSAQFQPVLDEGQRPKQWALDLQGSVPLQQLQLELPQLNTVIGLTLEQRNDSRQPWRHVASFVAWRLQRGGLEERSPPVQWNTSSVPPARYWRLVSDPRTAQLPAQALNASVGWVAPELLLVAQGGGELDLAVGRDQDVDHSVPWQTLVPGGNINSLNRLPQAHLGPLASSTVAAMPTNLGTRLLTARPEERTRWLLWAVLCSAVLGLAVLAWRLTREMKSGRVSAEQHVGTPPA